MTLFGDNPRIHAPTIRRAMTRPETFLAAALAELPDEDLADEVGADPARVWRLRLCSWPRRHAWDVDVQRMAAAIAGDAGRLDALLQRLRLGP
jgi:hypothetical protein